MPITWSTPATGQPYGMGYVTSLSSDFIGPLPSGSLWTMELFGGPTLEQSVLFESFFTSSPVLQHTFGIASGGLAVLPTGHSSVAIGSTVNLVVKLIQAPNTIVDQGSRTLVYEPLVGAIGSLGGHVTANRALGFTSTDRVQLTTILESVVRSWPGSIVLSPLIDLLTHPVRQLLARDLITPDRTGEGSLTRPGFGFGVNAFGIAWDVISSPAGLGIAQGAPDTWTLPILKLRVVATDRTGDEYTANHHVFNITDTWLLFDPVGPTRIEYWILPGVTIRFYWLLL